MHDLEGRKKVAPEAEPEIKKGEELGVSKKNFTFLSLFGSVNLKLLFFRGTILTLDNTWKPENTN